MRDLQNHLMKADDVRDLQNHLTKTYVVRYLQNHLTKHMTQEIYAMDLLQVKMGSIITRFLLFSIDFAKRMYKYIYIQP